MRRLLRIDGSRVAGAAMVLIVSGVITGCAEASSEGDPVSVTDSIKARQVAAREYNEELTACMTDHGFPATLQGDGGVRVDVADGQDDDYFATLESCRESIDTSVRDAPLSDAELEWFYEANLEAYECLTEHGFSPSEPVSLEVFRQQIERQEPQWSPFRTDTARISTSQCPEPTILDP